MGKTVKTTDIWGDPVEVHYDNNGNKTGKTTFETTWTGETVQVHRDTSGNKTGTTASDTTWTGESVAVHRDASGNKSGYTKNDTTLMGDPIQRHYDKEGHKVGKSTYEQTIFGDHYKKHTGDFHKAHSSEPADDKSSYSGSSGYAGGNYEGASNGGGYGLHVLAVIGVIIVVAISISHNKNNSSFMPPPVSQQYVPTKQVPPKSVDNETERPQSPSIVEPPQAEPTPPVRSPQIPMTRYFDVATPQYLTPDVRINIWIMNQGEYIRSLPIARSRQSGGRLYITLREAIPANTELKVVIHYP